MMLRTTATYEQAHMRRRGVLLATAIAAVALALPATAGAAGVGAGAAVSSGGLVSHALANTPDNKQWFTFMFVVPTGTCADGSQVPGVDLCEPWANIAIATHGSSNSSGFTGKADCSTLTNPTSWSEGEPVQERLLWGDSRPLRPLNGIYADIACDDGSGYDFYRVQIDDNYENGVPWGLFNGEFWGVSGTSTLKGAMTWTWGEYKGYTDFAHDNGASEAGDATVYGHDASGFHVLARHGSAKVFPIAADVVTAVGGATAP